MAEERIESYPFDSNPPTEFDDYGRPIYDRAVGAHMLRYTYKQFFSDGVFGTPGNALQIGKGDGLNVTVQPGMWIIEGAIGAVGFDTGEANVVKLADSAPQGKVAYGIFLRFDDNEGRRSMYLVVRAGNAGGAVPDVDSGLNVSELRLGYVTVPSGATDLSGATITMEKGTSVCPYAAPFEEIDVDATTSQYNASAQAALNELVAYFEQYRDMVDAAVDETLAGQLQTQINQLKAQLDNFDLSSSVDNKTIEYEQLLGGSEKLLSVKNEGITSDKLASGAVVAGKISDGAVTFDALDQEVSNAISPQWETLWSGSAFNTKIPISNIDEYNKLRVTLRASSDEDSDQHPVVMGRSSVNGIGYFYSYVGGNISTDSGTVYIRYCTCYVMRITSGTGLTPPKIGTNKTASYCFTPDGSPSNCRINKVEGAK